LSDISDIVAVFIEAACVPLATGHRSGTLDRAQAILAANPDIAHSSIHTAAILGEDATVRQFLERDAASATVKGGPRGWDALTHLCFSRYLRLDAARSDGFVRAATALLDAGASANTGWFEENHQPEPEWESAIYGAAGVAHHAAMTRLLLERGADPNDEETPYHAPETYDNAALKVLVESGKLNDDSLATMLLRKADWHDYEGIKWLLERGVDPNRMTRWGATAFHQAMRRDNALEIVELMLDHGADPLLKTRADSLSGVGLAARRGRGDVIELLERRKIPVQLHGVERLIGACARADVVSVQSIADRDQQLVQQVLADGGKLLAEFAGVGNTNGVRLLLDLGVEVDAIFKTGDGYFGVAPDSTALHVAAWRARHSTVALLIERGARVNVLDGRGRSPLALAVLACVDSFWTDRRSPESVVRLLRAGASMTDITVPTGYAQLDELLRQHGKDE
jgi:ankyrin repeat protein